MQFRDLILRCDNKNADGSRKKCPAKGYFYEVYFNGECIARSQTNPETDACRELLRRGLKGKARFWRADKNTHDLEMDVERGAAHVLVEEDRGGLRCRRYREFPDAIRQIEPKHKGRLPQEPSEQAGSHLAI